MQTDFARLKELFLAALKLPVAERSAFLESACAGDAALRREIEGMLQSHENTGELLPRSPAEMLQESGTTEADATAAFPAEPRGSSTEGDPSLVNSNDLSFLAPPRKPGSLGRLDHYEILEVVGRGGFGMVLRAFDEKLHRIVAIKVLSLELSANGTARQRFIREARTAAAVVHEHVVTIHAVVEEHRPPYLVMQMIDGVTLQQKLDKTGPLQVREILRIGMQMAEGLAAAHKQGLVHRDIKPANILLENGVERVKITDFGLARAVDDASVTQSGTVAGTPLYMSPEQAEGLPVDHRSDLFSLGTVLYAMCAGHPPFRASGTHAVLKRVIDASPRPIREVNSDIPEWLQAIMAKLHAKKPVDRFQTAKEVAEILGQGLAHVQQPVHAAPKLPLADRVSSAPANRWHVGDQVLAPLVPEWLYVCKVLEVKEDSVLVTFEGAHSAWVQTSEVRPDDIARNTRVLGFVGWWSGHRAGSVTERRGDSVHVLFDNGSSKWTKLNKIVVPTDRLAGADAVVPVEPSDPKAAFQSAVQTQVVAPPYIHHATRRTTKIVFLVMLLVWILCPVLVGALGLATPTLMHWAGIPVNREHTSMFGLWGATIGLLIAIFVSPRLLMSLIRSERRLGLPMFPTTPDHPDDSWQAWWRRNLPLRIPLAGLFVLLAVAAVPVWKYLHRDPEKVAPVFGGPGWKQLSDGKTWVGWKSNQGMLETIETLPRNFHLRMEVNLHRDSGRIYFRTPPGFEPSDRESWKVWYVEFAQNGNQVKESIGYPPVRLGITQMVEFKGGPPLTCGEWFLLEIIAKDESTEVRINDNIIYTYQHTNLVPSAGVLCLSHGGDNAPIEYRNLEVKDLTPADAPLDALMAKERNALKGSWVAISGDANGEALPNEFLNVLDITFGEDFRLKVADCFECRNHFAVDVNATPRMIISDGVYSKENWNGGGTVGQTAALLVNRYWLSSNFNGIYQLEGDRLKLCLPMGGHALPKRFDSHVDGTAPVGPLNLVLVRKELPPSYKDDKERLQGAWVAESVTVIMGGQEIKFEPGKANPGKAFPPFTLTFTRNKIKAEPTLAYGQKRTDNAIFHLDEKANPHKIDLVDEARQGLFGIYRFDGDHFVLCIGDDDEKDRPTEFSPKGGNKRMLVVFKRIANAKSGWSPLFNGKDLSGWVTVYDKEKWNGTPWDISEPNLILKSTPQASGYLRTQKQYREFHLRFEYRPTPFTPQTFDNFINCVVMWGMQGPDDPTKRPVNLGMELVQNKGAVWYPKAIGRGMPWKTLKVGPTPADGWNLAEVVSKAGILEFVINGEKTTLDGYQPVEGYIGLYSGIQGLHLRNIEINEMSPSK
jgi:uncharacterized protein (TIGR03067 family)